MIRDYEPDEVYRAREAYLDAKRQQTAVIQPLPRPAPPPLPELPAPPQAPEPTNPFVGMLGGAATGGLIGFGLGGPWGAAAGGLIGGGLGAAGGLERPAAGIRGFLGTPEDRLGGLGRGLMGGNPAAPTGSQLNETLFGLNPTQPNIGPLPFSPADVAGRATETALDPLTYAGGWVGKAARAPVEAAGLMARAAPAAAGAEALLPHQLSVAEQLARNTGETPLKGLGQQLQKFPLTGWLMDRVSPRMADADPTIAAVLHANSGATATNSDFVRGVMSQLEATPLRSAVDDAGMMTLTDGSRVAWGDVAENVANYASRLPPEDMQTMQRAGSLIEQQRRQFLAAKDALAAVNEEAAKAFEVPWLEGGYAPRYQTAETLGAKPRNVPYGSLRGFQQERGFETMGQGIGAGLRYQGPLPSYEQHFWDVADKITQMQTLTALQPYMKAVEEGGVQIPGIAGAVTKGLWLEPKDAALVGEYLNRTKAFAQDTSLGTSLLRSGSGLGSWLRMIQAAGDLSYALLQNLQVLARNPAAGLAAIGQGVKALGDTLANQKFLASPFAQGVIREFPGLQISGNELTERSLGRIPLAGGFLSRTQDAWNLMGNAARIYMADGLRPTMKGASPEAVGGIVDFINHATGVTSTAAMGVSPQQRAAESIFMFAPRFMRASLAMVGDLFHGGIAAQESAKTIASMLVAGAWIYQRASDVLGQTPIWDPADSRFMTIDIDGQRVGIGGTYRSLANVLGKIVANPGSLADPNIFDPANANPLVRFARGHTSPQINLLWTMKQGEDFIGNPVDNIGDVAKYAGTSVLPFAIASFIESHGTLPQRGIQAGATALGLRAFPEPAKDMQNRVGQRLFGADYANLDPVQKAQVDASEEVKSLPVAQGQRFARSREIGNYFTEYQDAVNKAATQVTAGRITPAQFRLRATEAGDALGTLLDHVEPAKNMPALTQAQQDRKTYLELVKKVDEFGRQDFGAAETYLNTLPQSSQDYITQMHQASFERLAPDARTLMQDLSAARETLKPYRAILQADLERVGLWEKWVNATPAEQKQIEQSGPYRVAARLATQQQRRMRWANPEIDAALVKWYGDKPIRQQGA